MEAGGVEDPGDEASIEPTVEPEETPVEDGITNIGPFITNAFQAVPEIGTMWRWYEFVYRPLWSFLFSRWGRSLPRTVRQRLLKLLNNIRQFNDVERMHRWDRSDLHHNISVPDREIVYMPTIWVAEFFPPSLAGELRQSVQKNHWDEQSARFIEPGSSLVDAITRSRSGDGYSWLRLGGIRTPDARLHGSEPAVRSLPKSFEHIQSYLVQIGGGLSVVLTKFTLTAASERRLNEVWHSDHDPVIVRRREGLIALDRQWAAFRSVQRARAELHNEAREWVRRQIPGAFAQAEASHPLMDLLLFEMLDPFTALERSSLALADPLRALGVNQFTTRFTSPQMPGLILQRLDSQSSPDLEGKNKWGIWGQIEASSGLDRNNFSQEIKSIAIGHGIDDYMRDILTRVGISHFLELKYAQAAAARDRARSRHGKFRRKDVINLRESILASSLDIISMKRDLYDWTQGNGRFASAVVEFEEPGGVENDGKQGRNFLTLLTDRQTEQIGDLVQFDTEYRQVLTTVASLGSSVYLSRANKATIAIAVLSVGIAAITFGAGDTRFIVGGWITTAWEWLWS